jgi:hypothetical protein
MNRIPDVDLVLRDYFADDGLNAPDHVLDLVEHRISRQPQRRSWPFRGRTTTMSPQLKLIAGLAAALVVAVVGYNLLPGIAGPGAPSAPPTSPPSTPAATVVVTPAPTDSVVDLPDGPLTAGRYRIRPLPDDPDLRDLELVADVPEEWQGFATVPALVSPRGVPDDGVLIGFMKAETLFSDPCHWDLDGSGDRGQPGDIVIEPNRESLVAALRANPGYTVVRTEPYSLDGFDAWHVELELPREDVLATCDVSPDSGGTAGDFLVFGGGFWAQGADNQWLLEIIEVDGGLLVALVSYFDETSALHVAAGHAIVESFEITP